MSGVSFPVTRPVGRALIVGNTACRAEILRLLQSQGYECREADDPYAAIVELCRDRLAYQTLIVSLASLYREELTLIATVKRRLPHVEIWLAQTDGRMAALAEGIRLGAEGLLAEDGSLHRVAAPAPASSTVATAPQAAEPPIQCGSGTEISGVNTVAVHDDTETAPGGAGIPDIGMGEPVLSADELRALLQDQPSMPPSGTES